ncbi:MAG: UDP-N-acetylmuramoyl-L-alanyl-D-glutamate--2,6-diaminopimelate ligase [Candidatus Omnitrophica bacterium]|nr:UDP-N-acetylmuramoyl-L-alanyl-D-glutamate--2,6-diaminopimelate ligase [Candidatus Omnitrophota bacterium]MDD4012731.1 UDP-N-acetylmuramoyl-L-alanyl-D-glutamate--2,6-diaminopimelate ligase [Candidatus Omnitrophota bacterium]
MNEKLDRFLNALSAGRDNVKIDSRKVSRGDIFVALRGTVCDGHDHIKRAFAAGASGVVAEREVSGLTDPEKKKVLVVSDTLEALEHIAGRIFERPSSRLETYGVTGTNGKTTSVFLADSVLNSSGRKCGFLSTVFNKTCGDDLKRASMTTADLITLNRMLWEMASCGKKAAVVEISSHALDQGRVRGLELDGAVFTNLTPEHLDYHRCMEDYLLAKAKIFKMLKPSGTAALNADDPMVAGLEPGIKVGRVVMFGLGPKAEVRATDLRLMSDSTEFVISAEGLGRTNVKTGLIGTHNVYNMLGVTALLISSGLDLGTIVKGLEAVKHVPGRLDAVSSKAPFGVYVDYAHTPNALENVLKAMRTLSDKKLICVFGCGGDRDRTKRPVMGRIASDICDHVVITSDNPRSEKPADILDEIRKGISARSNYSIIEDRTEAIRKSLGMARKGDVVVIAGKGHEDHQIIGELKTHYDDKEVAANILNEMGF